MVFCIYFVDDLHEYALLVEDEGLAQGANTGLAAHLLLAPCAEGLQHLGTWVGEQWEGQLVFRNEVLVRLLAILAHAIHLITCCQHALVVIAQIACLGGATWGAVFWIEIDDCLFAQELLMGHGIAVVVCHAKRRHFVSDS